MKPINEYSAGCDPISSNCVIWQGPNIECISLCKGDTVSTVVYKLATELCNIMDTLNVDNYDLSCFNLLECSPKDFEELIQLLIEKVCAANGIEPTPTTTAGCPDCIVPICSSFYYPLGSGEMGTTMQLSTYVEAIGNRVCTIISQISTIQSSLDDHESRITDLENAPVPTFTIPQITPNCVLPAIPTNIDVVLAALETQFCNLRSSTGDSAAILQAMQSACTGLNTANQLSSTGLMNALPGWFSSPTSLSQSFSNLWKTVCDIRSAITYIQNNCCDTGCNAIDVTVTGELTNPTTLVLTFNGTIPNNYTDQVIGSTIQIMDAVGGSQTLNSVMIKSAYYDLGQPMTINLTTVNGSTDLTIKTTYRFLDPITSSTCENLLQTLVLGAGTCPAINLYPDYNSINYDFTWLGLTPQIMIMELWNSSETVMLQSQTLNVIGQNPSGIFNGLVEGTLYKIRVRINNVPCPFISTTTLVYPCVAPTLHAPSIDVTNPVGTTTGSTIGAWFSNYEHYHPLN